MTDAADEFAAAIRRVIDDAVHAALQEQSSRQAQSPPRQSPNPSEENLIESPHKRMLYPLSEVQQRLGVGRSTVYRLVGDSQLPSVTIGRRRFVTAHALESYIEGLSGE